MKDYGSNVLEMLTSPRREIGGRVLLRQSPTTLTTIENTDNLKGFVIDRVGENGKFFGYGVSQKATVEVMDKNRVYDTNSLSITVSYKIADRVFSPYPTFYIEPTETKRDEKTNTITYTAYDALYEATAKTLNDIEITPPYTMEDLAFKCAVALGLQRVGYTGSNDKFTSFSYTDGANLEGTETIREILDDIAEATQTIYFVNEMDDLTFVDCSSAPVLTLGKSNYFELTSGREHYLTSVSHTTELGDNITAGRGGDAEQVIKDNAFMSFWDDLPQQLEDICGYYDGFGLVEYSCSWRGNPLLEIGDFMLIEKKDGINLVAIYVNDTHTYNGGLSAKTSWAYEKSKAESSNPTTLGQALKETYAKVDKANKRIDLVVSEVQGNTEEISTLQQTKDEINLRVLAVEEENKTNQEEMATLRSQVELAITKEALTVEIQKELDNGVNKVATSTGYTFDDTGLTIEKSGSEIKTQITEDGMTVYKDDDAVLTANNQGVKAKDLHAVTFLIVGNNSRFEDYNGNRTGCFWIGGSE